MKQERSTQQSRAAHFNVEQSDFLIPSPSQPNLEASKVTGTPDPSTAPNPFMKRLASLYARQTSYSSESDVYFADIALQAREIQDEVLLKDYRLKFMHSLTFWFNVAFLSRTPIEAIQKLLDRTATPPESSPADSLAALFCAGKLSKVRSLLLSRDSTGFIQALSVIVHNIERELANEVS